MASNDKNREAMKPTEQRGGSVLGDDEAREKGPWAATAQDGIVPAELGGSDAPTDLLPEDPELGTSVLGRSALGGPSDRDPHRPARRRPRRRHHRWWPGRARRRGT